MTLEQSRKIAFILKGLTSVLVKNLKFLLTLVFFLKKGLDKLFDYVTHRKQGFVDHKNDIKTKSKNLKFRLSLFFF